MTVPALPLLDKQVAAIEQTLVSAAIPSVAHGVIPSTIHAEVIALGEAVHNRLRNEIAIPPEVYLEEMSAFQSWMDVSRNVASNPVIVRAQVMTQLYVAFLWLRDSLMTPVSNALPGGTTAAVVEFLSSEDRRRLRNSVAHGRWRYQPDFSGLECWDGRPPKRFVVSAADLGAWQLLSRASTTAVLLALSA
jgi:hypothetical protein